jgi:hypothetical protein
MPLYVIIYFPLLIYLLMIVFIKNFEYNIKLMWFFVFLTLTLITFTITNNFNNKSFAEILFVSMLYIGFLYVGYKKNKKWNYIIFC